MPSVVYLASGTFSTTFRRMSKNSASGLYPGIHMTSAAGYFSASPRRNRFTCGRLFSRHPGHDLNNTPTMPTCGAATAAAVGSVITTGTESACACATMAAGTTTAADAAFAAARRSSRDAGFAGL